MYNNLDYSSLGLGPETYHSPQGQGQEAPFTPIRVTRQLPYYKLTSHVTRTPLSRSKDQRSRSRGQLVLRRKVCHIFVADKATLFKCRTLTDCGQFLFTDCKLPLSGRGLDDVTQFRNFATLPIFRKRLKLYAFQIWYTDRAWAVITRGTQIRP